MRNIKFNLVKCNSVLILVCYSNVFFFKLKLSNNYFNEKQYHYLNVYNSNYVLNQFFSLFLKKIRYLKFSGKSYYVTVKKKMIVFSFLKRNINFLFFKRYIMYRNRSKNILRLKFLINNDFLALIKLMKIIKKQNIFTGSGLSINKSLVNKKKGKVTNSR